MSTKGNTNKYLYLSFCAITLLLHNSLAQDRQETPALFLTTLWFVIELLFFNLALSDPWICFDWFISGNSLIHSPFSVLDTLSIESMLRPGNGRQAKLPSLGSAIRHYICSLYIVVAVHNFAYLRQMFKWNMFLAETIHNFPKLTLGIEIMLRPGNGRSAKSPGRGQA